MVPAGTGRTQMDAKQFKARVIANFKHANPGMTGLKIKTVSRTRWVRFPTGIEGWIWQFAATATGYRPSKMTAYWTRETGLMCR